jgi:hypothetical protein
MYKKKEARQYMWMNRERCQGNLLTFAIIYYGEDNEMGHSFTHSFIHSTHKCRFLTQKMCICNDTPTLFHFLIALLPIMRQNFISARKYIIYSSSEEKKLRSSSLLKNKIKVFLSYTIFHLGKLFLKCTIHKYIKAMNAMVVVCVRV